MGQAIAMPRSLRFLDIGVYRSEEKRSITLTRSHYKAASTCPGSNRSVIGRCFGIYAEFHERSSSGLRPLFFQLSVWCPYIICQSPNRVLKTWHCPVGRLTITRQTTIRPAWVSLCMCDTFTCTTVTVTLRNSICFPKNSMWSEKKMAPIL